MRGISCLALPIRDHAFFEQTVFQRQFRHNFLQGAGLTAQILHLVRGRCARRVAGEPLLPRLEEILRPAVIQVLDDSLAPAQFGDALLAAQAFKHDTDLLSGGEWPAGRRWLLHQPGFLSQWWRRAWLAQACRWWWSI